MNFLFKAKFRQLNQYANMTEPGVSKRTEKSSGRDEATSEGFYSQETLNDCMFNVFYRSIAC